ncbi:MAG: hypothetical protein ICV68_16640 [Pyrinomonadaceae bacterium]|nr:hypothetical protein [Pyrinomonadaceae bacterium]
MAVQLPEGRKEGTSFCPAVLHFIAQPDFKVTGIPDPGSLLCLCLIYTEIKGQQKKSYHFCCIDFLLYKFAMVPWNHRQERKLKYMLKLITKNYFHQILYYYHIICKFCFEFLIFV